MSSDYVIVGAGLSGTVLAARLSEDANITVTVLEAGSAPFHNENIDTPGYLLNSLGIPEYDWAFFSTPQEHLHNRTVYLPRGKSIGGSTLLNFLQYNRAPSIEYDALQKLGSEGWTWETLVPYFKKSETFEYTEDYATKHGYNFDGDFHGTSGPLHKRIPSCFNPITGLWIEGVKAQDIKPNFDPSAGVTTGVSGNLITVDDRSIRSSAASAYYEPNQSRPNLKVICGALVTKVLISGISGNNSAVAHGVEYLKDGTLQIARATKEVILSAGSYKTPQILELSGIGDPKVLKPLNIDVIVNLPGVGNNLQVINVIFQPQIVCDVCLEDHISATYTAKLKPGLETWSKMEEPAFAQKQAELFKATGTGILAGAAIAYAFLPFKDFDKDGALADLAYRMSLPNTPTFNLQKEWVKNDGIPFLELSGYNGFMLGALQTPEQGVDYISSSIILLHPFNRGSVHISSTDPIVVPLIDHNYLDNELDIRILVEGYKFIRDIFSSDSLRDLIDQEVCPGPEFHSDEDIAEYTKKVIGTTFHPIGTACLLPQKDGGVVDTRLRVYGTKKLRVVRSSWLCTGKDSSLEMKVDASVLPFEIGAHLQGTLYAISEKAADLIREDAQI